MISGDIGRSPRRLSSSSRLTQVPILTAFVLTAMATTVAQLLPSGRQLVPLALLLDLVPPGSVVIATALATRSLRGVSASVTRLLTAVYGYFAGGLVGAFGVAHTVAVALAAVERARYQDHSVYTFRLYALMLLGVLLMVAGFIATVEAGRLARGQRAGWRASLSVWAAVLLINLPLVPLQGFAVLFSVLAGAGLLFLAVTRRHFARPAATDSRSALP